MGKHSKKTKDKKSKLQQKIHIDSTDDFKKNKSNIHNMIDNETVHFRGQREKIKKRPSKFKKFFIKLIIILLFTSSIIVGIWQGIEMYKWQTLAKQMCKNTNSIVVDLKR